MVDVQKKRAQPNIELVLLRNLSNVLCQRIRQNNDQLERLLFLYG